MDVQMMQNQIDGMIEKGKDLRQQEAVFLKVAGIDEEIAKTQIEKNDLAEKIETLKTDLADLKEKKRLAVEKTAEAMALKMGEILPEGTAIFETGESGVFIGWNGPNGKIPYDGLSGGQKTAFDAALAHALTANIIVIEAAELDSKHLDMTLEKLKDHESQILINTCHAPTGTIPENFNTVTL